MASILSQHCEERLVFQFRIDNLRAMFNLVDTDSGVDQYDTAAFGPGFFFRLSAFQSDLHGPCADLGLYANDDLLQPVHMEVTIDGRSRDNESAWFSFRDSRDVLTAGSICIWDNILSAEFMDGCVPMRRDNAVVVMAVLKLTRLAPPPASVSKDALDLLHKSLESKELPTVRWTGFSARRPDGTLTKPLSVFAPRDLLVSPCEEIERSWEETLLLLDGTLYDPESLPLGIDSSAVDDLTAFSDYESDYDDDEVPFEPILSKPDPPKSHDSLPTAIDWEADITEEPIVLIDEDAIAATPSEGGSTICTLTGDDTKRGDILLRSVAHRTLQALIYYLYTGIVVFAPLSSDGKEERDSFLADYKKSYANRPTPSSCKALYDVAVKLGLNDLQKRAFVFLRRQLSETNIIDELFSPFTSRHAPVREMEVALLVQRWNKLTKDSAFEHKLEEMARGERPYAASLVMHILRAVAATECRAPPASEDHKEWWDGADIDHSDISDETYSYHSSDCDETTDDDMDYEAETENDLEQVEEEASEVDAARGMERASAARAAEEAAAARALTAEEAAAARAAEEEPEELETAARRAEKSAGVARSMALGREAHMRALEYRAMAKAVEKGRASAQEEEEASARMEMQRKEPERPRGLMAEAAVAEDPEPVTPGPFKLRQKRGRGRPW
ncbi:uncharacterized protein C8Q71DRAFT_736244 [Rhodofomes roseus]|uniref:Uncharacterized protein n=1 Tax=Rhodofomes roseus TaxID=34475 RepID=A0ABQ8KY03_9APHY|nr:uncharacterized protein C8Q71DRAFT_736244 [Rhodofomes roseus]KAH9843175.1 hypothetical protein C8Q71DRAFT_736244 [Rhodofomes roseus]